MLRQAQQLQAKLAKIQDELANTTIEASSGGDGIKVIIDGQQKIRAVEISPEVIATQDIELLQDLIMTAVNGAIEKSQSLANERLGSLTATLNIPGLI